MNHAVIVDCLRTPIGRSHPERGWFRATRGDDLAIACVTALVQRKGIDPAEIEDVVLGCTQQTGEHGANVARLVALAAGLPTAVCGITVNRLCGSSLQALHQAAQAIMAGSADVQIVGGLEHMQHLPPGRGSDLNPRLFHRTSKYAAQMGLTAEHLARVHGIGRREQDEFALRSHRRAAVATERGEFRRELVPLAARDDRGASFIADRDQCIRADTSLERLTELPPAFLPEGGTVTAGNSSPLNDGAAAMLVMSERRARALGYQPLVRIRAMAIAGVEPCEMGLGPVPAAQRALQAAGLSPRDLDLIEINEAFAVQTIACSRLLGLAEERLNVRGGAIAIGHPLGASGARIATTLVHAMLDGQATLGLAAMCIGFGQGIATIFERVA